MNSQWSYPNTTIYDSIIEASEKYPNKNAHIFLGKKTNYKQFFNDINCCAKALCSLGLEQGDHVGIVMPNCPQALVMFYAVNAIGCISNTIHPLSSETEINYYLKLTDSKLVLTLDVFVDKVESSLYETNVANLIVTSIADSLGPVKNIAYKLLPGKNKVKQINKENVFK